MDTVGLWFFLNLSPKLKLLGIILAEIFQLGY
jgi:hypothetical protein